MNVENLINSYIYVGDYILSPLQTTVVSDLDYNKDDILAAQINSMFGAGRINVTSPPAGFPRGDVHTGDSGGGSSSTVICGLNTATEAMVETITKDIFGFHAAMREVDNASGTWFAANKPLAMPFTIRENATIKRFGWFNGSAPGGNFDVGIYDTSWNKIISTGSVLGSGASTFQFVSVGPQTLFAGRYYLVFCLNNITANRIFLFSSTASALLLKLKGCYDSATDAFPLPSILTNMVPTETATRLPLAYMDFRTWV